MSNLWKPNWRVEWAEKREYLEGPLTEEEQRLCDWLLVFGVASQAAVEWFIGNKRKVKQTMDSLIGAGRVFSGMLVSGSTKIRVIASERYETDVVRRKLICEEFFDAWLAVNPPLDYGQAGGYDWVRIGEQKFPLYVLDLSNRAKIPEGALIFGNTWDDFKHVGVPAWKTIKEAWQTGRIRHTGNDIEFCLLK